MAVFFDLDLTLVDSSKAEQYRNTRSWNKVYELIPQFELYPGIKEVIDCLGIRNIPIIIVTNSPSIYASKVLSYFNIEHTLLVDYFTCNRNIKPKPDQFIYSLVKLNLNPNKCISIGDKLSDKIASEKAGIKFFGAAWDKESDFINPENANRIFKSPYDFFEKIKTH